MKTDFNEQGQQYGFTAFASSSSHYNMLNSEGCNFYDDIERYFTKFRNDGGAHDKIKHWIASLECLKSFFYQSQKMKFHSDKLREQCPPENQLMCLTGMEALTDFESLLYHARATLDRLTFAVARQTFNQSCDKFQKLPKILYNFRRKENVEELISLIEIGVPFIQGILIDHKGGKTGLRSLLAHSKSTGEATDHAFTINRGPSNEILYFDLDIYGKGILNTSHTLTQVVPYFVLNTVSLLSGVNKKLELSNFIPSWEPRCLCLADFIVDDGKGVKFTTLRADYHDIHIKNICVKPDIFSHIEFLKS